DGADDGIGQRINRFGVNRCVPRVVVGKHSAPAEASVDSERRGICTAAFDGVSAALRGRILRNFQEATSRVERPVENRFGGAVSAQRQNDRRTEHLPSPATSARMSY